ncbi:hypothetical protein B566_EDAN003710 [Ephemera danica]|nr:hypothetical protein B566_EDAN003710 [Ephemera danica]
MLDQRMQRFVITILNLDWLDGSTELFASYQQFLVELLVAHNYYTVRTLERLFSLFNKVSKDPDVWPTADPSENEIKCFTMIHEAIAQVLRVIPMAGDLVLKIATSTFPYMRRSPKEHQVIVYNLLRICQYQPILRPHLLALIISRMVTIDVQIPRELIEDEDSEDSDVEESMDTESSALFSMDDVQPSMSQMDTSSCSSRSEHRREMKIPMAQTLDVLMEQMFSFIERLCPSEDVLPNYWVRHRVLYRELCDIFETQLLLTHGSHHVQFIMFYLCSIRPPTLVDHFVGWLWSRVIQPGETAVLRQSAVCYVASLLARAKFASPRVLRTMLRQMSDWCHAYVAAQQDATSCDVRQHPVFYTVCQALFYVVAFRHADLVNTNKGLLWTQALGLGKLVTSRLNPLKPCLPGVAKNFAAVTRTYQLAYCYTVLERNARAVLPCVNHHSGQTLSTRLSTFFPFDPYLLRRSSRFISAEYREYEALEQPAGAAVTTTAASDGEETHCTDDEEEAHSPMVTKNSMSPCSLRHLVSPKSFPEMFSYGTSPGFKNV